MYKHYKKRKIYNNSITIKAYVKDVVINGSLLHFRLSIFILDGVVLSLTKPQNTSKIFRAVLLTVEDLFCMIIAFFPIFYLEALPAV